MPVIYGDDEQRLVTAAKNLATTISEQITVETLEAELKEAISLNKYYNETIAKRRLRQFIESRSRMSG